MAIHYALFENNLTSDPGDYMAIVQPTDTADLEDVIDRIIQQGSTVGRPDIVSVLEDYYSAIENLLLDGMNVVTPGANYGTSIKGVFNGQADRFDPSRHRVTATTSPGVRIRRSTEDRSEAIKDEAVKPRPNPMEYIDINSGTKNSVLTPNGMGQIVGHRLKFDRADPDQGIYFVAADDTATKVDIVGRNMPADLMFTVPASLVAGDYTLEVRAAFGDAVRAGVLDATLTVTS